jgi:peptidoglycan/xylan/chitin deacetylase (PgdA/CDA1 family)
MSKRELARSLLSRTGLTALRWRTLPRRLYCFNYHRIGDPETCPFDRGVFSCTEAHFREHVALLRERFEVVDLERLPGALSRRSGRPPALITFDDGYADNYQYAFPILKEMGVTAVFFIPTAFPGGSSVPWWDEIAWVLRRSAVGKVRLRGSESEYTLEAGTIDRTVRAVLRLVRSRAGMPMREQVLEVREACRVDEPVDGLGRGLFVSWAQVKEMHGEGMDIGSHTHTHEILSHLPPERQEQELSDSKCLIEGNLGAGVRSVAYPVGSGSSYTAETCRIAESLGYEFGFNFRGGFNPLPLAAPYDIRRMAVDGDIGADQLRVITCFPMLN